MAEPNDSDTPASIRYRTRLALLEALSARLSVVGVPHTLRRHTPNSAPTYEGEQTIPALDVGDWARVRILYWLALDSDGPSEPWYVVWDSHTRWATDEDGVDRLASILATMWLDRREGEP